MNLEFQTVSKIDRGGIPCLVQRAVIPGDYRKFWIIWKSCHDPRLKDNLMLRKEAGTWAAYRTLPVDPGIDPGPLPMPYVLKSTERLLPYQSGAVSALTRAVVDHGCGVDGSDTGLGKSYTALAACRELGLRPAIICRKPGIAGWKEACRYMNMNPVFICNWEYARTGKFPYCPRVHHAYEPKWIYKWEVPPHTLLIFDECHMACNDGTLNNQLWVGAKGRASIFLSATLADRPVRLASLFHMLGICDIDAYRQWLLKRGYFYNNHNDLESISTVQDMVDIHKILYPRYGARLSYQDPEVKRYFPEAVYQVDLVNIDRPDVQNKLYLKYVEKVVQYRDMGHHQADIMVAELRYRQASELLKAPVLADLAVDYLAQGLSVIIFVNYRETLAALSEMLKTKSLIFGDQERMKINREEVIGAFQDNRCRIIISMIDAGGQSINLHDLRGGHQRISLICPTYNPISLKQVMGRTYRANTRTIPIMKLVYAADTIEEKVAASVKEKLNNIEALNRGDMMEPDIFDKREDNL